MLSGFSPFRIQGAPAKVLDVQGIIESCLHPPQFSLPMVRPPPMQQTTSPGFSPLSKLRHMGGLTLTLPPRKFSRYKPNENNKPKPNENSFQHEISDFMGMCRAVDRVDWWCFRINEDSELGGWVQLHLLNFHFLIRARLWVVQVPIQPEGRRGVGAGDHACGG